MLFHLKSVIVPFSNHLMPSSSSVAATSATGEVAVAAAAAAAAVAAVAAVVTGAPSVFRLYSGAPLERTQQEQKPSNNGRTMKVPNFFSLFLWMEPPSRTDPSITEIWGITDRPTGPSDSFTPANYGNCQKKMKRMRRKKRRRTSGGGLAGG